MEKQPLKILVINRSLNQRERVVRLFEKYEDEGFDLIIFPVKENTGRLEVIFFSSNIKDSMEKLFGIVMGSDDDDPFYDFDLEEIDEQTFYDVLGQLFEVSTSNLTDVEKMCIK